MHASGQADAVVVARDVFNCQTLRCSRTYYRTRSDCQEHQFFEIVHIVMFRADFWMVRCPVA
jgi:hypothetical protein